jgi:hypothetical protein
VSAFPVVSLLLQYKHYDKQARFQPLKLLPQQFVPLALVVYLLALRLPFLRCQTVVQPLRLLVYVSHFRQKFLTTVNLPIDVLLFFFRT